MRHSLPPRLSRSFGSFLLSLGLTVGLTGVVRAESPESAPTQLKEAITSIDTAANSRNLAGVMQFYGTNFRHSDGLNRQNLEQALTQLWQRYPQLTYRTELKSWNREGNAIVAETVTQVMGTDEAKTKLESSLRSRQRFEDQKIVQQDILSEQTQLSSGAKPPTVSIYLPEQIRVGQQYNFDAVVQEPLENDVLMGAALEEPVSAEQYLKPSSFDLEILPAGGLYKLGRSPAREGRYWLSAVLVRSNGMTMITRRVQVVGSSSAR